MRKIILLILIMAFGTSFAFADTRDGDTDTATPSKKSDSFYLGFGSGIDFHGSGWDTNYTLGGGAQIFGGYAFNPNWALQVNVENWFFESNSFSLYHLRTFGSMKYTFSAQSWQPYLLAGVGSVYSSLVGVTAMTLDAIAGVGVQFDLTADTHFFVEGRYNFILPSTGSLQDIPLSAGIWVNLP